MPTALPKPVIIWFRNDLRLSDQSALHEAVATGQPVIPVFIWDRAAGGAWAAGAASRWWLHHSLSALQSSLQAAGTGLVLRAGPGAEVITALADSLGATDVFTGCGSDPASRQTDAAAAEALGQAGRKLHVMRTNTLFHPASIKTKAGGAYAVYTPFANACLALGGPQPPLPAPKRIPGGPLPASDALADWGLLPTQPDWAGGLRATWTPGEAGAQERIDTFLSQQLSGYVLARDRPGGDGTSMLSPHLHFGEISAVTVWHMAMQQPAGKARDILIRELLWREFCANLLWQHPELPDSPLRKAFAQMPWHDDPRALRAWQRGRTGVPIVDAGMRQLWQIGWMHNRVRMIVASFLIKHLMIAWQDGEAWFWDALVDADLASNAANWQWVAGCGADASPFFRIFNPVLQGRKFDADGAYVRRFVPELARLPARYIHTPWEAPRQALAAAGVQLGETYPLPLVDLRHGRDRALDAYAQIRAAR